MLGTSLQNRLNRFWVSWSRKVAFFGAWLSLAATLPGYGSRNGLASYPLAVFKLREAPALASSLCHHTRTNLNLSGGFAPRPTNHFF